MGTHAAKSRPISPFAAPPPFLCSRSSFLILIGSVSLATTSWKTRRVLGLLPRVAALGGLELRSNCSRSIFVALLGPLYCGNYASLLHFYHFQIFPLLVALASAESNPEASPEAKPDAAADADAGADSDANNPAAPPVKRTGQKAECLSGSRLKQLRLISEIKAA